MTGAADWSGRVGETWAHEWRRTDRAFADLAPHLDAAILAAAPRRPFAALDIGCGAGTTAIALATSRPDATVIGVDLSPELVATARARAGGVPNCRFIQGDAVATAAGLSPDLLVSRHGVMFFPDPRAAFAGLRAAAAPGVSLVFTCFAAVEDNPWATLVTDAPARSTGYVPGPFALADPAVGHALLVAAGWQGAPCRVDFRYRVGAGDDPVADAAAFLTRIGPAASALRDASREDRPALDARLRDRLERRRHGDAIDFPAAAWLWSATATTGNTA